MAVGGVCLARSPNNYECGCTCDKVWTVDVDMCVPPAQNPNVGGTAPTDQQIRDDCATRGGARAQTIAGLVISTTAHVRP